MAGTNQNPNQGGRPQHPYKPDATVYEPDSLKKARALGKTQGMTDEQARREQQKNKGKQVY